jgi:hypothetical protein
MEASRLHLALGASLIAVLIGAAPALATSQTVNDPKGDAKSDVDIKKVVVSDKDGTITATITTYKSLVNAGRPCLEVRAGAHATTQDYWFVGCFGPKPNKATLTHGNTSKTIHYKQTKYSLTYTFTNKTLGVGASFRWRAVQLEEDRPAEAAPNHGWIKHTMDVPTATL